MMVATGQGRWGFTDIPKGAPNAAFVINAMQAGVANAEGRPWTITLGQWQQSPGQTDRTRVAAAPIYAVVTLNGGGTTGGGVGTDTFQVDWPAQGCTIHVHASGVKVDVIGTMNSSAGLPMPTLTGWLTVGQGPNAPQAATWTSGLQVVADGVTTLAFPVPSRAHAYRLFWAFQPVQAAVTQVAGAEVPATLSIDFVHDISTGGSTLYETPNMRATWFPLHPQAQVVTFSNNSGVGQTAQFYWSFLLDPG